MRKRKGGVKKQSTVKHLVPGVVNQLGATLSAAIDAGLAKKAAGQPPQVKYFGLAQREREEFAEIQKRPLSEQVEIAVVGSEKFRGCGPGLVLDLTNNKKLDGLATVARIEELAKRYSHYRRWVEKEKRWKGVKFEEPLEYRTISFPRYWSAAFQAALGDGSLKPEEFLQLVRKLSYVARDEFRLGTHYPGAAAGMEAELAIWHFQQGVMHLHLVVRKVSDDGVRLGLVGSHGGRHVWNELELPMVAERRRRANGFLPIPQVGKKGEIVEDHRTLNTALRSRVFGDLGAPDLTSARARDRGLGDPWDLRVNDAVDMLVETYVWRRPELLPYFEAELTKAKQENAEEFAEVRRQLGLAERDDLRVQAREATASVLALRADVARMQTEKQDLDEQIEKLRDQTVKLESDQRKAVREAAVAAARLARTRSGRTAATRIDTLQIELAKTRRRISRAKSALARTQARAAAAETEKNTADTEIQTLSGRLTELEAERRRNEEAAFDASIDSGLGAVDPTLNALSERLAESEGQLSATQKENAALAKKLDEAGQREKALQKKASALEQTVQVIRAQAQHAEGSADDLLLEMAEAINVPLELAVRALKAALSEEELPEKVDDVLQRNPEVHGGYELRTPWRELAARYRYLDKCPAASLALQLDAATRLPTTELEAALAKLDRAPPPPPSQPAPERA